MIVMIIALFWMQAQTLSGNLPEKRRFQPAGGADRRKVGAVIVATGMTSSRWSHLERMLSPNGPTQGKILRPSDGKIPKEMVFIQCVASRDPDRYMPYCSRVCCMYTAKHAKIYKEQVPDGQPYVFYMDIRSDAKGYEEFLQKTIEEDGCFYLRGRVSRVFQEMGR
jgi:heterodisulfide reductase subunit A-like polyferredoxin